MQPGFKSKSRGLQAFVRGKSDSNAHYNTSHEDAPQTGPEKRSATPNAEQYVPSRQELAEFAKLPLPGAGRKPLGSPRSNGQQLTIAQRVQSPARRGHASPNRQPKVRTRPNQTQPQHDIFTGSQLGENFMYSGISTPMPESEDLVIRRTPDIKAEEPPLERRQIQRLPPRPAPVTTGQEDAVVAGDDGRLSIVPGLHRYHPSHMKDGFYNNVVQNDSKPLKPQNPMYSFPAQTYHPQPRLPMRGVRINRGPPPATNALTLHQEEVKDRLVARRSGKWEEQIVEDKINESILVNDSEDDLDALGPFGGMHPTSKPKLLNGHHIRPTREDGATTNFSTNVSSKDKKRRRPSLDYDDKMLSCMTYHDLQGEPFDVVPQLPGMNGHDAAASNLATRLTQFQQQGEREQHQFFANMSIEDWEDSGDWFAEQFSGIMGRLREARRSKRQMIRAFETEASHREEAIRLRTEALDRKLAKMKQDGQRVVGDKEL